MAGQVRDVARGRSWEHAWRMGEGLSRGPRKVVGLPALGNQLFCLVSWLESGRRAGVSSPAEWDTSWDRGWPWQIGETVQCQIGVLHIIF